MRTYLNKPWSVFSGVFLLNKPSGAFSGGTLSSFKSAMNLCLSLRLRLIFSFSLYPSLFAWYHGSAAVLVIGVSLFLVVCAK